MLISLSDLLMNTPRAQTVEDVNTGEDQKEESDGFNKDIVDSPHNDAAVSDAVNEEQELKTEKTQSF